MSSGIIMRNGIQYGNAVLNKADEILTDDNKTVQDELNTLKTSLNDFIVKGDLAKITVNLVANGWTDYITLPSGFTFANTYVTSIRIDTNGSIYRYGEGIETAGDRIFAEVISSNKLRVYNNSTKTYPVTIMLMKANL